MFACVLHVLSSFSAHLHCAHRTKCDLRARTTDGRHASTAQTRVLLIFFHLPNVYCRCWHLAPRRSERTVLLLASRDEAHTPLVAFIRGNISLCVCVSVCLWVCLRRRKVQHLRQKWLYFHSINPRWCVCSNVCWRREAVALRISWTRRDARHDDERNSCGDGVVVMRVVVVVVW